MTAPTPASVETARELLTAWSEEEGCSVVSRYEGDRWDKLVEKFALALDAAKAAVKAEVWEEAATRAGYADRRLEELFLKEAAAIRGGKP